MSTIVSLRQTIFAFPSEWEAQLDDGRALFIRYRWGTLSATVAPDLDSAIQYLAMPILVGFEVMHEGADLSECELEERLKRELQRYRARLPGAEHLYLERVGEDYDGSMSTREMLAHLQTKNVRLAEEISLESVPTGV